MKRIDDASASVSQTDAVQSGCSFRLRNIRTAEALARFAGDEGRLKHWLLEFNSYGAALTAQISNAIASTSPETAINRAHALKGRAGMLGMVELHAIIQSLELALKNGEPATIWLDELERTMLETRAELTAVLGEAAP